MNIIGQGSISQIKTNGKHAIKIVNMDYHYTYIKELIILRYLNLVSESAYFPKLVDYEERNGTLVMEKFRMTIAQVMDGGCIERTRVALCVHLMYAIQHLHSVGVYHQNLSLCDVMTKFETPTVGDLVPLSIIDYGACSIDKKAERHDLYALGVMMIELISGERIRGKITMSVLRDRIKSIDVRYHSILKSLISEKVHKRPSVRTVIGMMNIDSPDIVMREVPKLELKPPVYWVMRWVEKSLHTIGVNLPVDHLIITSVICTVTPANDDPLLHDGNVYAMLYGSCVLFLYSCLWNEVISVENMLQIIPECFGMNRNIIFMYALDELIKNDSLIYTLIRGI